MSSKAHPVPAADHVLVRHRPRRYGLDVDGDRLSMDGVALDELAAAVGTPTYVYGARHIEDRYRRLVSAVSGRATLVCYAVKANSNQAVLRLLARLGAGADIVSGGELRRARAAGFPAEKIVFSGVGKTREEIDLALDEGIRSINVESRNELELVSSRATSKNKVAPVCLRINPDVDPDTHPYLATGLREAKFGIAMQDGLAVALAAHEAPGIELMGLACHIGSQIIDPAPFLDSFARLQELIAALDERGISLRHLDLGGGLGIPYAREDEELEVESWGAALVEATRHLDLEMVIEPGRYLVGNAGVLLTRVLSTKQGETRKFVIVDAAMNDLLRPALYQAHHIVVPTQLPPDDAAVETVDVVGPICESGDFIAKDRSMCSVEGGALVAILSAGAYGMTMASTYNTRPLAAEVMVHRGEFDVVRPRQSLEELIGCDRYPAWLE